MSTAALILAAGGASRFSSDTHKLRHDFRGRPLVTWAVDAARSAGFDEVVVVTGAVELGDLLPGDVTVLDNDDWAQGQAGSLQLGIEHCRRAGHSAVIVGLGDQPLVPSSAWRAVAGAEPSPIVAATYQGARRNPVRLDQSVWPLLPIEGDEGGRVAMREHPDLVTEVACAGNPVDINTLEDLESADSPR